MANLPNPHDNNGITFVALSAAFGFFSLITTFLRLWVRGTNHQLGKDDLAIAISMCLYIAQVVFVGLEYSSGQGRHEVYLTKEQIAGVAKWGFMTQPLLFLIICMTKVSICFFILRIKNTGWLKWFCYALMAGVISSTIPCFVIVLAQCQPISASWNPKAGHCWTRGPYNGSIWAQVAFSIFSDLACSLLPIAVLWNVKIARHLKVAVCGLMSLGLLATACAAVRASLSREASTDDITYTRTYLDDWATMEENLGIIAANLALSRTYYKFLRNGGRLTDEPKPKYYQQSWYTEDHTKGSSGSRFRNYMLSSLLSRSHDDEIPLHETGIKKTMSLDVENVPRNTEPSSTV